MPCILVADDSGPFAEMLRASLEDAGYEVCTAYSGLAAVAAVQKNDVALAVLDVLMPGMSGDAVAERLRLVAPGLPIVLMTGADRAFAAAAGLPVLRKPFPHEELIAMVNRLLGR
jgi:two-component system OmpR family response regulator